MLDETRSAAGEVCIAYSMTRKRSAAVIYGDLYDLEVILILCLNSYMFK
jgi:hypothetical protein